MPGLSRNRTAASRRAASGTIGKCCSSEWINWPRRNRLPPVSRSASGESAAGTVPSSTPSGRLGARGMRAGRLRRRRCWRPRGRRHRSRRADRRRGPLGAKAAALSAATDWGARSRRTSPSHGPKGSAFRAGCLEAASHQAVPAFVLHRTVLPAAHQQPVLGSGQRDVEQPVVLLHLPLPAGGAQPVQRGAAEFLARRPKRYRAAGHARRPPRRSTRRPSAAPRYPARSPAAPASPWRHAPS